MTDTSQRDIIRKKFSLTIYHDELLDDIVEQRYASRSEAVRAAIQHHAQYLSEGGETDIDTLQTQLEQIAKEISTVEERIEESNSGAIHVAEQVSSSAENRAQSKIEPETELRIVRELTNSRPLSVDEIAESIEENIISVIPATKSLQEEGIIRPISDSTDKYELNR